VERFAGEYKLGEKRWLALWHWYHGRPRKRRPAWWNWWAISYFYLSRPTDVSIEISITRTPAAADAFAANVRPIIEQIRASGVQSFRGIARALAARGVKTARGGQWSAAQVSDIVNRPFGLAAWSRSARRNDQGMSLRKISAELAARGYVTAGGKPYVASAVQTMLGWV
jgi:Recombinase